MTSLLNLKYSLSQPPIDYLSDLWSGIAVSFPSLEINEPVLCTLFASLPKSINRFARNFACTWRAHLATKSFNIPYTCRPRACKQSLKFSDQSDVSSLCNKPSKFKDFSSKNDKLDDVTKWS